MFDNIDSVDGKYNFTADIKIRDWASLTATQAYGIYALGLYCSETDFLSLAADANTDGADDKKLDLIHIDKDTNTAYIGQVTVYAEWDKESAESNKASDLAVGMGWLLQDDIDSLPSRLQPKAQELRDLLESDEPVRIELLFIHNASESKNADDELRTVAVTTKRLIGKDNVNVAFRELGINRIQDLFDDLDKDILISVAVRLPIEDHFCIHNDDWEAAVFVLPGNRLKELYSEFTERLFSANIRGYLSVVNKKGNINKVIRESASNSPLTFWPYNNGITILTNNFTIRDGEIVLEGLSIINGAQTTGVVAELNEDIAANIKVPCRVVACTDEDIVNNIIRYNNTQNAIKSFDLRSNDATQHKLQTAFKDYEIEYAHRRSGLRRLPATAIHADTVAPCLASFHGEFQTAIRNRADIFESDEKYNRTFPAGISAEHVFLVQTLSDAIDEKKSTLKAMVSAGEASSEDELLLKFLSYSTSKQFLIAVTGRLCEQIVGGRVADRFGWKAIAASITPDKARLRLAWTLALDQIYPLVKYAAGSDPYKVVRSTEELERVSDYVSSLLESLKTQFSAGFDNLRSLTSHG
ncbi:MAG: hypothetical protein Phyf2KO_12900 [Phycisphaerales bacterium]